ncbi:MAG: alginate export family protein [Prosthecobacter sp.]|nr:alginate export family protein [Prosthecobacter sp.]
MSSASTSICAWLLLLSSSLSPLPAGEPSAPLVEMPNEDPLKFNFHARVRGEWRENVFDFNNRVDAPTDDTWLLHRLRIGLEWQALPWLKLTLQGQDVRESFSDRADVPNQMGAEGDDAFDLRLASLEFGDPQALSLKAGRQILAYGDERLVGPLEWLNFSRTFDAVKLHYQQESWWLDAFTSSVVRIHESHFNTSDWLDGENTRDQIFSGLYFSTTAIPVQTTDLYAFHLHEEGLAAGTDFITLGTRFKGDPLKLAGWDYTFELAGQAGQVRGQDLRAFATHLEAGYNWLQTPWKPRLALEYSYGSGDGDAADGKTGTFQNLFPTNHPPYGFMDTLSWQNMHNLVLRLAAQPHPKIKTTLDLHGFWLADTGDAWYRANGTTQVRPINGSASNQAGAELDFTINTKLTAHLDMLIGYSRFFAGQYLDDTGAGDDAHFGYLMLTLNY